MGEDVVRVSQEICGPKGLFGAFCIETIITPDAQFYIMEVSARIVAGTNLFIDGSPYSYLNYSEPMSTGRRIADDLHDVVEARARDQGGDLGLDLGAADAQGGDHRFRLDLDQQGARRRKHVRHPLPEQRPAQNQRRPRVVFLRPVLPRILRSARAKLRPQIADAPDVRRANRDSG